MGAAAEGGFRKAAGSGGVVAARREISALTQRDTAARKSEHWRSENGALALRRWEGHWRSENGTLVLKH